MSVEGDLFRVTVKGSRESVVKMMNAALRSFNSDNVIEESDDVETMNAKLEMFAGEEGEDIGIPDLILIPLPNGNLLPANTTVSYLWMTICGATAGESDWTG